jgi:hypothetical protein
MPWIYSVFLRSVLATFATVTATSTVPATRYVIDVAAAGPRFDGIGAISGGGGETVLLPAYPTQQRSPTRRHCPPDSDSPPPSNHDEE